jgi:hypothetical protein
MARRDRQPSHGFSVAAAPPPALVRHVPRVRGRDRAPSERVATLPLYAAGVTTALAIAAAITGAVPS